MQYSCQQIQILYPCCVLLLINNHIREYTGWSSDIRSSYYNIALQFLRTWSLGPSVKVLKLYTTLPSTPLITKCPLLHNVSKADKQYYAGQFLSNFPNTLTSFSCKILAGYEIVNSFSVQNWICCSFTELYQGPLVSESLEAKAGKKHIEATVAVPTLVDIICFTSLWAVYCTPTLQPFPQGHVWLHVHRKCSQSCWFLGL